MMDKELDIIEDAIGSHNYHGAMKALGSVKAELLRLGCDDIECYQGKDILESLYAAMNRLPCNGVQTILCAAAQEIQALRDAKLVTVPVKCAKCGDGGDLEFIGTISHPAWKPCQCRTDPTSLWYFNNVTMKG